MPIWNGVFPSGVSGSSGHIGTIAILPLMLLKPWAKPSQKGEAALAAAAVNNRKISSVFLMTISSWFQLSPNKIVSNILHINFYGVSSSSVLICSLIILIVMFELIPLAIHVRL